MIESIKGGVTAAAGFKAASVHCGLKSDGVSPDLAVLYSEYPTQAAALFTKNRVKAAPVRWSRIRIHENSVRAIVVNAGNANACTGERGLADVERTARTASELLGLGANQIFIASTGIIGEPLPIHKIEKGLRDSVPNLSHSPEAGEQFSRAIMTTDTVPKSVSLRFDIGHTPVSLGGATKGAGMIAPNMATMLCFITTDAAVTRPALERALRDAVEQSFNRITVDGHTSTNDTVVILANGAAGNAIIEEGTQAFAAFCEVVDLACLSLAKMMVRDGEGATKVIKIEVTGAQEREHATTAARAIANSPLVKTAVNGCDPNWGRIISAAGYSGCPLDEAKVRLWIGGILAFDRGLPSNASKGELEEQMQADEVHLKLDLGMGGEADTFWTCDFSEEYVKINAAYHT